MGYDYVESAGYFGYSAKEVKEMLDKYGLECVSVHQTYDVFLNDAKAQIEFLNTIGAKYCAIPWMGLEEHKGTENYDKNIADITMAAKDLKEKGIQMLYHNHDFEFNKFENKFLLDWFYDSFAPDLMQTEIDTCWVHYAGYDPTEYIKEYSDRAPVVHLKDFVCKNLGGGPVYALIDNSGKEDKTATREDNGFEFRPVGYGIQNFPEILKAAKEAGAQYVIVEQDDSYDADAMENAKKSREYLKSLGL
jgi:sugar phosphate isomerase/epimerase